MFEKKYDLYDFKTSKSFPEVHKMNKNVFLIHYGNTSKKVS